MSHCPVCKRYFAKRSLCTDHVAEEHSDWLEEHGYTPAQGSWLGDHPTLTGKCTCCPECREITQWCDRTGKPYRVANNPECRARVAANAEKNLAKAGLDKHTMMSDMDHQREMRRHRHTSGKYRFKTDGGVVEYDSQLELNWLMFCDKILELPSCTIQDPPEYFPYHDPKTNTDRWYAPDYFMPDYMLMVEIKDGGGKPNGNPAYLEETRYKVYLKDEAMKKQDKYNFIRISGKNYGAFMEALFTIVHDNLNEMPANRKKHQTLCVITESVLNSMHTEYNASTEFEQIESGNVKLMVKYVEDTYQVQYIGITDSMYEAYWMVSDYETQFLTQISKMDLSCIPGTTRYYKYAGDSQKIHNAFHAVMEMEQIDDSSAPWDILWILRMHGIYFDDGCGTANNNNRKSDFIKYKTEVEEGEYVSPQILTEE